MRLRSRLYLLALTLTLLGTSLLGRNASGQITAVVGGGFASPTYVNLYWDTEWDTHHTAMPKAVLDSFTASIVATSYFGGLSEYGVRSASFAGGFLPNSSCWPMAPPNVGFYDPVLPSIIGFLNCELQHGGIPTGPQVIYNIILPNGVIENDGFGAKKFCIASSDGGMDVSWHFHETPYTPEAVVAIGIAGINLVPTTTNTEALTVLVTALNNVAGGPGGPFYTISSVDGRCGTFTNNLLHEMAEAASDPVPPVSVITNGGTGEIVDDCGTQTASTPFVASISKGPFTTAAAISAPQYWSNANQKCVQGFNPDIQPAFTVATSGNGANTTFAVSGSGLGTLPNSSPLPANTLPYLGLVDSTQGWEAGNLLNNDAVGLNIVSWSNSGVIIQGLNSQGNNLVMKAGDNLSLWACNPVLGQCNTAAVSLQSDAPQLKISMATAPGLNLLFDVSIDGQTVLANSAAGSTGWQMLTAGTHIVGVRSTNNGLFKAEFSGACDANGHVTLNAGDNQICRVVNVMASGCPSGDHCCGEVTASGCSPACVPNTVACQPLCPTGTNKCCGGPSASGRCSGTCIKSPPQSCQ